MLYKTNQQGMKIFTLYKNKYKEVCRGRVKSIRRSNQCLFLRWRRFLIRKSSHLTSHFESYSTSFGLRLLSRDSFSENRLQFDLSDVISMISSQPITLFSKGQFILKASGRPLGGEHCTVHTLFTFARQRISGCKMFCAVLNTLLCNINVFSWFKKGAIGP